MYTLKNFLPFVFFFVLVEGSAQNLVPNPSFEVFDTCPDLQGQVSYAYPWYNATFGSSVDYYNSCSSNLNVPWALSSYQNAINGGNAFVGLYGYSAYSGFLIREYLQAELLDPLVINHTYHVSFYVNLCDICDYSIDKMGAYLSDSTIYSNDTSNLPFIPQIESSVFLSDTANWMHISGYYQAHGGEKYITLGNFRNDTMTNKMLIDSTMVDIAYYYVDSVSLIDCTSTGINELQHVYFTLLQNPVSNSVCFTSPMQLQKAIVYNLVGEVVKEQLLEATNNYKIDVADLPKGLYFLVVEDKKKLRGIRKFVKQ